MRRARSVTVWMLFAGACTTAAMPRSNPPPAPAATAGTEAARLGGRWSNRTSYCIEPDGRASEVATHCPSGDPGLDQLYREAVAGWTFEPARRGDSAIRTCATSEFAEDFAVPPDPSTGKPTVPVEVTALDRPQPDLVRVRTVTARYQGRGCFFYNLTSFCVGTDGLVGAVTTTRSSGVPDLDEVFRDTVAAWRFAPSVIAGEPRKICSRAEFNIRMQ